MLAIPNDIIIHMHASGAYSVNDVGSFPTRMEALRFAGKLMGLDKLIESATYGREEISSLDMDLLTVLSRIYQARHLIERIDPNAERILTCDAPRLAGHVSDAGLAWCERTDLDTAFPGWLREIR